MLNSLNILSKKAILPPSKFIGVVTACVGCQIPPSRGLHTSEPLFRSYFGIPASWKQAKLREKKVLIRNHEYGTKEIYYKNNKRIDNTRELRRNYIRKSKANKKKGIGVGETKHHALLDTPVDDVYLENTIKPRKYSTQDAIEMLKKYTALDLIDDTSPIILKLNIKTWKPFGRSKKKRICLFSDTVALPHPISVTNKVCVFAHEERFRNLAMENGAFVSGSNDVVRKIMQDELECDKYLVSEEYSLLLDTYDDLKKKLQKKFPDVKEASDDFVEQLTQYKNSTIFDNYTKEGEILPVKIGQPIQTTEQIKENIAFFMDFINEYAVNNAFKEEQVIISAEISCFTEYIPLDISELFKESDI